MLAIETNRSGIIERLAAEHRNALLANGIAEITFRNALWTLRADHLLAASLVNSLQEVSAIVAAAPGEMGIGSRYVAIVPTNTLAALPAADAYLVRNGESLRVVKAAQLQLNADTRLVGYFVAGSSSRVLATGNGITPNDGSGSGSNSWIGYLAGSNNASGSGSAVAAGTFNSASGQNAFVGAGQSNVASGTSSLVIGGFDNQATVIDALVVAGAGNRATGARSVVVGGGYNLASGNWSFVGGGGRETGSGPSGTNLEDNIASGNFSAIVGGRGNRANNPYTFVGGGEGNVAGDNQSLAYATVSGGRLNSAIGSNSAVGGGSFNRAYQNGTVAGGYSNIAAADFATIGGGSSNIANGYSSTIGGGNGNRTGLAWATVAGGGANDASGDSSTVIGGIGNTAGGSLSTVLGGQGNNASGDGSLAAGCNAHSLHAGSIVFATIAPGPCWGQFPYLQSTAANEFSVGAIGGFRFIAQLMPGFQGGILQSVNITPAGELTFPEEGRQQIRMRTASDLLQGMGGQASTTYFRSDSSFAWFKGGTHSDTFLDAGAGGATLATLTDSASASTVTGTFRAQVLTATSDRNAKTDFVSLNAKTILAKVAQLPISTWSYRNEAGDGIRHIGPTAQDFQALFGVGYDEKSIATVDADGVALAAIKGLVDELQERDTRNALQQQRIVALEQQFGEIAAAQLQLQDMAQMVLKLKQEIALMRQERAIALAPH